MGVDLHGQDVTKAARRAIADAIHHNSLVGLGEIGLVKGHDDVTIDIIVAVPNPDQVNKEELAQEIRMGTKNIQVVNGGMLMPVTYRDGRQDPIVIATAGIVVNVP